MTDLQFQTGGTLVPHKHIYVDRQEQEDLFTKCISSEYCYILAARQLGKSSMAKQVIEKLKTTTTILPISTDLSAIARRPNDINSQTDGDFANLWYKSFLWHVLDRSKLSIAGDKPDIQSFFLAWWKERLEFDSLNKLTSFFIEIILAHTPSQVVVFVDEIDRFPRELMDDFLMALRYLHNERSEIPELERLSFVLIGHRLPRNLTVDKSISPFNIGSRIDLGDLEIHRSEILTNVILLSGSLTPRKLLERIFLWTNGHPYLTHAACKKMYELTTDEQNPFFLSHEEQVDLIIAELSKTEFADIHLNKIVDWLDSLPTQIIAIRLYGYILIGNEVAFDETIQPLDDLRYSGLIKVLDGKPNIRNKVYSEIFNKGWVVHQLRDKLAVKEPNNFSFGLENLGLRTIDINASFVLDRNNPYIIKNNEETAVSLAKEDKDVQVDVISSNVDHDRLLNPQEENEESSNGLNKLILQLNNQGKRVNEESNTDFSEQHFSVDVSYVDMIAEIKNLREGITWNGVSNKDSVNKYRNSWRHKAVEFDEAFSQFWLKNRGALLPVLIILFFLNLLLIITVYNHIISVPYILMGILAGIMSFVFYLVLRSEKSLSRERRILTNRIGKGVKYGEWEDREGQRSRFHKLMEKVSLRLENTSFGLKIARKLVRADMKFRVGEYFLFVMICSFLLGILSWYFSRGNIYIGILGIICGLFLPVSFIEHKQRLRLQEFQDQIPDMLVLLVNSLRAGYSLMQAMENVSRELHSPVREEFRRVVQEMQIGISMEMALEHLLRRIPSGSLTVCVEAIKAQREAGGNLSEILDSVYLLLLGRRRALLQSRRSSSPSFWFFIVSSAAAMLVHFSLYPNSFALIRDSNEATTLMFSILSVWVCTLVFIFILQVRRNYIIKEFWT